MYFTKLMIKETVLEQGFFGFFKCTQLQGLKISKKYCSDIMPKVECFHCLIFFNLVSPNISQSGVS